MDTVQLGTPQPATGSLEDMLAFCARRAMTMAERADAIDPQSDPYGHGASSANADALKYLKAIADIGRALGQIQSHKVSEVRVYRHAEPLKPAPSLAPKARTGADSTPPPPQFAFETKDPKFWTPDEQAEFERENDREWEEMMRDVAQARKARLDAGTHVRLLDGQIVEIPEGETAESVLRAARQGEYGHEAAHAAFDAEVAAEVAKAGQGEGGPLSDSERTNAGK